MYYLQLIEPFVYQLQAIVQDQEEFSSFLQEPKLEKEQKDNENKDEGILYDSTIEVSREDESIEVEEQSKDEEK